jgi:protoporphyrinogen oxidase
MAGDPHVTHLAMEYFCSQADEFWQRSDLEILEVAKREVEQLRLARATEVADGCVVRVEKAYPVYEAYFRNHLSIVREFLGRFRNLQMIGRNGMHKYNNQDHSMLTGMLAARNVMGARHDLWDVNADPDYMEEGAKSDV